MNSTTFRTVTVPAGSASNPGIVVENVHGRFFATVSTTGLYYVRANNGVYSEQNGGRHFGSQTASEFSKLTFYNFTAAALTVVYYAGDEQYIPDPSVVAAIGSVNVTVSSTVTNAPTTTKATAGTLAAGDTLALTGLNGVQPRKALSIFNDHATDPLLLRGANGAVGHKILAQQGYPLESGGALTLYNPGVNDIDYYIMEVFY